MTTSIVKQIAEIQGLPLTDLRARWRTLYGTDPPAYSREYLVRRLAYRVQELAHGGLPEATRAALRARAGADGTLAPDGDVAPLVRRTAAARGPVPGTRYVRLWHGERHEVTALPAGHEYRGKVYRSLSGVAKEITGQHWNGRLFFGLRTRGRKTR